MSYSSHFDNVSSTCARRRLCVSLTAGNSRRLAWALLKKNVEVTKDEPAWDIPAQASLWAIFFSGCQVTSTSMLGNCWRPTPKNSPRMSRCISLIRRMPWKIGTSGVVEKIWSGQSARYEWDKIANFCGYYRYHHCMFNVPFSAIPTKNDIINFIPNSHSKVMIISENCGRVRKPTKLLIMTTDHL